MSKMFVILGIFFFLSVSHEDHHGDHSVPDGPKLHQTQLTSSLFIPDIPEECLDTTYCEHVPNYPDEYVTGLLERKNIIQLLESRKITKINAELKHNLRELTICDFVERDVTYPRAAKSAQGEWFFILNPKKNPFQAVKQVICSNENSKCQNINFRQDLFYNTGKCKQETVKKQLKGLDRQGKMMFMHFPFKCCCSCYVTHTLPK